MFVCVVSILSYGWMCEALTAVNPKKKQREYIWTCDAAECST